ncbi:condensation domain-containing protein [Methanospirillum stamsii]|uniref:Condensation protein n=1 Tax=Methanospirillum stamsii TaxID=1277351 RepID=A0A2V2NBU0_9EURY|nr:condensation domain-containing protein [Methanospirillum stamsii]PWR75086.1 condensation protein [Methanospirillum stamsii]
MTQIPKRYPASAFDVFNVLYECIYEPSMHVVFEISGEISIERLKTATLRMVAANPYLHAKFTIINDTPFWEELSENLWEQAFVIDSEPGLTPPDYMPLPLDVYAGPQIRVTLYQREETNKICVTCHHGFCDARAILFLSRELFDIYRRLAGDPDYTPEPLEPYDRTSQALLATYSEEELKNAETDTEIFEDYWRFPHENTNQGIPKLAYLTFPEDRLKTIKAFGRSHGASVHDILIAAFFMAMIRIRDNPQDYNSTLGILTTADMRRLLPVSETSNPMNYSIAFEIQLRILEEETLPDIISDVVKKLKARINGGLGPSCFTMFEDLHKKGMPEVRSFFEGMKTKYASTGQKNPVLSNIGVIDLEWVNPAGNSDNNTLNLKDAWLIPCVCWPYCFLTVVSTCNNRLTLMIAYEEGPYSKDTIEEFLKLMDSHLP